MMRDVPSREYSHKVSRADCAHCSPDRCDSLEDSFCDWFIEVYFELPCDDVEVDCREVDEGVPEIELREAECENVVEDEHWILDLALGTLAKGGKNLLHFVYIWMINQDQKFNVES